MVQEIVQSGGDATLLKTTIPGLQLWLDGRDINGDGTANPASVNTWKDKSGAGNDATLSTMFSYSAVPTSTADGVLLNSGGQSNQAYYTKLSELPAAESAFFLVTFTGIMQAHNTFLSGTAYNTGRDWRRIESKNYWNSGRGSAVSDGSTLPFPMNTRVLAEAIFSNETIKLYIDGKLAASGSLTRTNPSTQGSLIGATQGYGNFLQGTIHEIIVFNRAVPNSQRQQVEGYLATKWGIAASLPTTHPYYNASSFASVSYTPPVPLTIFGLEMWYDATDINGDGSTTNNSTNLTSWKDKSGNGYNLTAISATAAQYNSTICNNKPGVAFFKDK
jgi:hypothetical protein